MTGDSVVILYDCEMCDHVGETTFQNIQWLANYFAEMHEDLLPNGLNDIPILVENLEDIQTQKEDQPDERFLDLMESYLNTTAYAVIRWIPKNGG